MQEINPKTIALLKEAKLVAKQEGVSASDVLQAELIISHRRCSDELWRISDNLISIALHLKSISEKYERS